MKFSCKDMEKHLIDFVYDEPIDPVLKESISGHMKECRACLERVESYRSIKDTASGLRVDFEPHIWELHKKGIKEKIEREEAAKKRKQWNPFSFLMTPGFAAAALSVMILAGVGIYYKKDKTLKTENRAMIEKLEILENMEILERLEFYSEMSEIIGKS
ncbi:MAG TPA: hypothetical protein ENN55_01575 [Firmicutes bacterium]|nr:hypothetical protein [Bacillota bacterium]